MSLSAAILIDIRLLCATNRDLLDEVEAGRFRQDLYYRLAVVEVGMPPLRDRPADIPVLAKHFLGQIVRGLDVPRLGLGSGALRALIDFDWPGNVRQLENVLTKATLLAQGPTIRARDLELPASADPVAEASPPASRDDFERREAREIAELLDASRWNIARTARQLGISRTTLYARMRKYGINR